MSANTSDPRPTYALNDWSRPIPVRRFGVLLNEAGSDAWAQLTPLGEMAWTDGTDVDSAQELAGWPASPRAVRTRVLAAYDSTNLYLRVVCDEPRMEQMRLDGEELWRNDHIAVSIDPRHDHWRYCQVTILPDGRMESAWNTLHSGFVPADMTARREAGAGPAEVAARTRHEAGRWEVDVAVPWRSLGLESLAAGQCIGLNVSRWRTVGCEQLMQWSPTLGHAHDARLFGDLYLGAPAAILQEIRLGGPNWGPNRGYAKFVASRPFQVWVEQGDSVEPIDAVPVRLTANEYGLARYDLAYRIDPREIMRGQLTLKWSDADGGRGVSSASFVFGWKRSVLLTHAAGREGKAERPSDGRTPDFFPRMCDYLLAKLPRYRREGGRYLVADRAEPIDLLGPDPLMPMARAVVERIEGRADQLAACALVLCQPQVLISSGTWSGAGARGNPGSILWTRGTFCDTYSMMAAELAERVAAVQGWQVKTGLVYMLRPEGASLEWPNHFWGGVWLDHGVTILDAELGRFFYRRDGRALATLDDMFDDPSLAEASGIGMGDYFRMHSRKDVVIRYFPRWREVRPVP